MSLFGLSQGDPKLDASLKAFYRWRRANLGYRTETTVGTPEEDKQFHAQMLRAVDALKKGQDWRAALSTAGDYEKVSASLYGRTVLRTPQGKHLSDEQLDVLRKHIGDDPVNILISYDAMLRQVARELSDKKETTLLEQPTGTKAIDIETGTQRHEHLMERLSPDIRNFLGEHQLKLPSYRPEVGRTKRKELLEKPDAEMLEVEVAREYEAVLRPLLSSVEFSEFTDEQKKKFLSTRLESARKRAEAIVRSARQQRQEQTVP
jgi:hypothetical protein